MYQYIFPVVRLTRSVQPAFRLISMHRPSYGSPLQMPRLSLRQGLFLRACQICWYTWSERKKTEAWMSAYIGLERSRFLGPNKLTYAIPCDLVGKRNNHRLMDYVRLALVFIATWRFQRWSSAEAVWPICYDYAVKDGCYKRSASTGEEIPKAGCNEISP